MVEVEITGIPPLARGERSIVDHHTLLNLYNVVRTELLVLGKQLSGSATLLSDSLAACERRIGRLGEEGAALRDAAHDHDLDETIHRERNARLHEFASRATHADVVLSLANLDDFLWILRVRARELLARSSAPPAWTQATVTELEADFHEWLRSLAQFSRGRFRFVYNLAEQGASDYYVDLRFGGTRHGSVRFPPVMKDVLRDLIANARKYTAPGGQIRAALHSGADGLRLVVEDNGRGIPGAELPGVVEFGRRGSNVGDVRTLGAGCGLTKAFLATRELGGRFWIASEENRGTRVRLALPPPAGGWSMAALHE